MIRSLMKQEVKVNYKLYIVFFEYHRNVCCHIGGNV